jgi:hypothetical protein
LPYDFPSNTEYIASAWSAVAMFLVVWFQTAVDELLVPV